MLEIIKGVQGFVDPADAEHYNSINEYLRADYEELQPLEFYRELFPAGSFEQRGYTLDRKPNGIIGVRGRDPERKGGKVIVGNRLVFDGLEAIEEVQGAEFAVMSAIGYSGRNRTAKNARLLYGFIIDLDGVTVETMTDLFYQVQNDILPCPSYVISSGHGLHIYYVFDEPIPLYQRNHKPLNALKYALTNIVWNAYTSTIRGDKRQFQSIWQGFRMPGTSSKLGPDYPVRAYRTGKAVSVQGLNSYLAKENQVVIDESLRLPLAEAKKKYPEWYENRIVKGNKGRKKWDIAGKVHGDDPLALYHWWIEQMKAGAFEGNRYNCMCALAAYAVKCDVPEEQLRADAAELRPYLDRLSTSEKTRFTEQDVNDALEHFKEDYATYSIKAVNAKTKIQIEKNKRNGRKQADHVKIMNFIRDEVNHMDWRNKDGRPVGSGTKEQLVKDWIQAHPDGTATEAARDLGISRTTFYKYR